MKHIKLEGTVGADGQLTPQSIDELRAQVVRAAARLPLEKRSEALEAFEKMIEQSRSQGLLTASASSMTDAMRHALQLLGPLPHAVLELARALGALHKDVCRESYTLGTVAAEISMATAMLQTAMEDLQELVSSGDLDGRDRPLPSEGAPS